MKRFATMLVFAAAASLPVFAQDGMTDEPPPDEPPPDVTPVDPPPDVMPPDPIPEDPPPDEVPGGEGVDEEQIRQKMIEKLVRERVEELRRRMDAAKSDAERSMAISESVGGSESLSHPLIASAVLPYINPRPIRQGLQYGDGTVQAALDTLKRQPFDETYYGIMKSINDNRTNEMHVLRCIQVWSEIRAVKAIPTLVKFMQDKREDKLTICRGAVDALGKIMHRDAIPALIAELEEQDKAGANDQKAQTRRSNLNVAVLEALKTITSETFKLGSQYRQWWNKNKDTFQKAPKVTPGTEGSGSE
ncbi:MAG: HEAT repeat domain-containing protein [Candidatus Brocadiae bacterium]|nr:HEAT repeat domain-containing protein [Candidatus Brocadiia bacterium]